mmetsp:Transcript_12508/g.35329  ORF Transcript_12508/g.35329 Transcript_12508/m.35329 type:complete len:235 (-) Transcript_12508:663-1367(-)
MQGRPAGRATHRGTFAPPRRRPPTVGLTVPGLQANLAIKCPIKISIADEDEFAFPWAHKFYCMVESCLLSDVVVVCGDASLVPRAHGDFPVKLASNDVRGSVRILNPVRGTSVSLRNNLVTNAWPYRAAVSVCSIPSRRTLCGMQPCSGRGPSGPCTCPCGEVEVTGNSISGVDLGMFITCPSHLTVARNTFSGCSRPVSCGRCKNCVMHHFQKLFCSSDGSAHGAYQCELLYQ